MAVRIDTSRTTEVEVGGETFTVRTLTSRQKLEVMELATEVYELLPKTPEGEVDKEADLDAKTTRLVMEKNAAIVDLGLEGDNADGISPNAWPKLAKEIIAANRLEDEDRKN